MTPAEPGQLSLVLDGRHDGRLPNETARSSPSRDSVIVSRHRDRATVSTVADRRAIRRLVSLAGRINDERDPLRQAKLLTQLAEIAHKALGEAIVDANAAGHTWRAIGAHLNVAHQTLYRRYSKRASSAKSH